MFVALPSDKLKGRFIEIEANGKCLILPVGDVGPWNGGFTSSGRSLNDPYWRDNLAPETGSGTDLRGRPVTDRSPEGAGPGIDISAAAAQALGLTGNTWIPWRGLPGGSDGGASCGCSR